jgi:hypothetical protein
VVRIKALADPAMRERNPQWESELRELVEAASEYYEREFDLRLVTASTAPWPVAERIRSTSELLLKAEREFAIAGEAVAYDLVIAFTAENVSRYISAGRPRVDRIGNCRDGLSRYAVVPVREVYRDRGPAAEMSYDTVALIHELGHVFGAEHVTDTLSIMHDQFDYRTEFDMKNRNVILRNRNCPFAR